ncbi:hypothetical protein [Roseobacter sp. MH60115]|nr:hypothetical protein [Roseobacter sp. MH60115]
MPRKVREKVGEIHRTRIEKTFFDHVKEVLQGAAVIALGIIFLIAIFT